MFIDLKYCFISVLNYVFLFYFVHPSQAQVVSDNSLPTSTLVSTSDGRNFIVTEGTKISNLNLFHSFTDFSIPRNGSVVFQNPGVETIISRVTGNSTSQINGLIQADANLFLINPRGIVFGSGSQLDISGSFVITTANRINFADGNFLDVDTRNPTLLTMSMPIGLQLGAESRGISVMGEVFAPALSGRPGTTLIFLGNGISLDGGALRVPSGRIELGSVAGPTTVSLGQAPEGLTLEFDSAQDFRDISLNQQVLIDSSDFLSGSAGPIRLYGRNISLNNSSAIVAFNFTRFNNVDDLSSMSISIKATDSLLLNDHSSINIGDGNEGLISIDTKQLILRDFSIIDSSTFFSGRNGNLLINASELVELQGGSEIRNVTLSNDTGTIVVNTDKLRLIDGGQLNSSTLGGASGNARGLDINTTESIEISGQVVNLNGDIRFSSLLSETVGPGTTGNGGNINITTNRLSVKEGGTISTASRRASQGAAGSINIFVPNETLISGLGSTISATSESSNPAGSLFIRTGTFTVENSGAVSVSAKGIGSAGSLLVNAETISLQDQGMLLAATNSTEGNINLGARLILLINRNIISTDAFGGGSGGNIRIDSDIIFARNNSDITANAIVGAGGQIDINAQGIFGLTERTFTDLEHLLPPGSLDPALLGTSDVTSFSRGGPNLSGTVIDPSQGLIDLPAQLIDASRLISKACSPKSNSPDSIGKLFFTGKSGFIAHPEERLSSPSTNAPWVALPSDTNSIAYGPSISKTSDERASSTAPLQLVEAQGWQRTPNRKLMLMAESQRPATRIAGRPASSCQG